jgi:metallo-beta-lactamase family protein
MATLTFLGATGTVTGSRYLLEAAGERLMIDCGLFQGAKELRLRNWSALPIPASRVDWVVLTHAHLDHTGYIPRFAKQGFRGLVYATAATFELCKLLLPDSGHLQEEDARYANKKGFSRHKPALPLYTYEDAVSSLNLFRTVDESKPLELSSHFSLRFFRAGHILGARSIEITVRENGSSCRVVFSGDLGRYNQLLIKEPQTPDGADILLVESTYGDRLHPTDDYRARLASIAEATSSRGGSLVIPAFAVGRTQELLYIFREIIERKQMRSLPIHVDSPMAIDATGLYLRHHEDHNLEIEDFERRGMKPFSPPDVHFDRSPEESKALNVSREPMIIISASGMATGGRVLHHLERCLPDSRNKVLFVGYQGEGTRGRVIQSRAATVKIHGRDVAIQAQSESMENLSGHADSAEILRWLRGFRSPPRKAYLVHGEPPGCQALQKKSMQELGWDVEVRRYLEQVPL